MSCGGARRRLSPFLDGELSSREARAVAAHVAGCAACGERLRSLRSALERLAELPRLECRDGISARIFDRLEVESRGPGLALVFRPFTAARPLLLPSLLPAVLVFIVAISGALALPPHAKGRVPGTDAIEVRLAPWGTESNPLFPSSEVSSPRAHARDALPDRLLEAMPEGSLFVEAVVARDGTVSTVTLLEGDSQQAGPLLAALRRTRFEPGRLRGRPVAVSVYRLISRMDVHAPVT